MEIYSSVSEIHEHNAYKKLRKNFCLSFKLLISKLVIICIYGEKELFWDITFLRLCYFVIMNYGAQRRHTAQEALRILWNNENVGDNGDKSSSEESFIDEETVTHIGDVRQGLKSDNDDGHDEESSSDEDEIVPTRPTRK